ncbi:hypothetical protein ACWEOW_17340 [Monashia sp. NPDC004114]
MSLTVGAGLVAWFFSGVGSMDRSGPVHAAPNRTIHGASMRTGEAITWGGVYLLNDADESITIEKATLVPAIAGSEDAVEVERVEAQDPKGSSLGVGIDNGDAYEAIPASQRHSVPGFVTPPRGYANLLIKVKADEPGTWRFDSVDIEYRVGERRVQKDLIRLARDLGLPAPGHISRWRGGSPRVTLASVHDGATSYSVLTGSKRSSSLLRRWELHRPRPRAPAITRNDGDPPEGQACENGSAAKRRSSP